MLGDTLVGQATGSTTYDTLEHSGEGTLIYCGALWTPLFRFPYHGTVL